MRLKDKVALVTGGGRSMGRAIALRMASEGADVAVNYNQDAKAAQEVVDLITAIGRQAIAVQADVSQSSDVKRLVKEVLDTFGKIDILCNNAGILARAPFLEISEKEWDRIMDVDLKGPFLISQEVAKHMVERRSGRIINTTSVSATIAWPGLSHYQAAKGGLFMLTRGMALELAPYGVQVNAIAPGLIETDMNRQRLSDPAFRQLRLSRIPMGRVGDAEDIAGVAVFLASDDASFMTGATVTVDGGQTTL